MPVRYKAVRGYSYHWATDIVEAQLCATCERAAYRLWQRRNLTRGLITVIGWPPKLWQPVRNAVRHREAVASLGNMSGGGSFPPAEGVRRRGVVVGSAGLFVIAATTAVVLWMVSAGGDGGSQEVIGEGPLTTAAGTTTTTSRSPTPPESAATIPPLANYEHTPVGGCVDFGYRVETVRCSEPHDGELFARIPHTSRHRPEFPGELTLEHFAGRECADAFGDYVGVPLEGSGLEIGFVAPTRASWLSGERSVMCFTTDAAGFKLKGSVRDSGGVSGR